MGKNISKNISESLISKYCQKLLYHAKQSAIDAFKTFSKRVIQKNNGINGVLTGYKIAVKITRT